MGNSVWRDIGSFPVDPLHLDSISEKENGVYLKSTFNWLAIQNKLWYIGDDYKDITVDQVFIVSLDLRTETYNQYLLPPEFDEVPPAEPIVSVLGAIFVFLIVTRNPILLYGRWRNLELNILGLNSLNLVITIFKLITTITTDI